MTSDDVLVVGAGPTGLTAALVLAQSGVRVRVVAASAGPAVESRALVVHARTLELWYRLGIAEEAVSRGHRMQQAQVMADGKPAKRPLLDLGNAGEGRSMFPFALVLAQSETERLLLGVLEQAGVTVDWGTTLVGFRQHADGVDVDLRRGDALEQAHASWVVGADGASSTVRKQLSLAFVGGTYDEGFFLADVALTWDHGRDTFWVDLTRDGMFAFFPMAGEDRFRVIGTLTPEIAATADRGELSDSDIEQTVRSSGGVEAHVSDATWIAAYRLHHRRAEQFRQGRVFLAGDAAHVHSPTGGQGMNTGIGDAFNLAWKLAAVVRGELPVTVLDSYAAERIPVADALLNGTDRAFALQGPGLVPTFVRRRIVPRMSMIGRKRLSRVFFGLVSQTWISYRKSPAVVDRGRRSRVRAGDRIPHVPLSTNRADVLAARLTGLGWHLLVLPDQTPDNARLVEQCRTWAGQTPATEVIVLPPSSTTARRGLGVTTGSALLLVRPDGHIAVRTAPADLGALHRYRSGASRSVITINA